MTQAALTAETFDRNARAALTDVELRRALRRATTLFGERRREAMASVADWEGARDRARAIKDETLLHLDRYLEEFSANAERAGAEVHWARDAREACDVIGRIAQERGARMVVKSKSMASEEIHLNAAMADRGIEAIETDLGEYIIQLAGEVPSHIVVPAIHKTKGQIAALFAAKLGIEPSDDATSPLARGSGPRKGWRHTLSGAIGVPIVRRDHVASGAIPPTHGHRPDAAAHYRHGQSHDRATWNRGASRTSARCMDRMPRSQVARASKLSRRVAASTPERPMIAGNDHARREITRAIRDNLMASAPHDASHALAVRRTGRPLPVLAAAERAVLPDESLPALETFKRRLLAVGAQCVTARDEREAASTLAAILSDTGAHHVVASDAPLVERLLSMTQSIQAKTIDACSRAELFDCDVGLTTAQWGIAETGTLVLESGNEKNRLLSLIPPVHVALLPTDHMCDTIGQALARVHTGADAASRAITFITGPSRTSDIELTLTIGVHGPQVLYVILLEESR